MATWNEVGRFKDFELRNIKFDSFCELHDRIRKDEDLKHSATLYYNGSDLCGDVGINFARYADERKKNTILELAGVILKHFS